VHVPDPFSSSVLVESLAESLAPGYRILSLSGRGNSPYQVDATDLRDTLRQFGFSAPVLVGERLGCLASLLVAAWYPTEIGGLVLIDPTFDRPADESIEARSLRDCPPDIATLRKAVRCPVLEASGIHDIETFLAASLP
jgi:pimeloyl-ACP methyl ester carboxylesterase